MRALVPFSCLKFQFISDLAMESKKELNLGKSILYQISWVLGIYQVDMFIRDIQKDQQPNIIFKWEVEALTEFWKEEEKM